MSRQGLLEAEQLQRPGGVGDRVRARGSSSGANAAYGSLPSVQSISSIVPALGALSASGRSSEGVIIAGSRPFWSASSVRRSVIATGMYPVK